MGGAMGAGRGGDKSGTSALLLLLPFSRGDIIVPLPEEQRREGRGQGRGVDGEG